MLMLSKNQKLEVEILDLNHLGFGVAKVDGLAVFVAGAVTGDKVQIEIIKANRSFAVGRVLSFIEKSPLRCERCPVKGCRACAFREISYEQERNIKRQSVLSAFHKAGLKDAVVLPVVTGDILGYRNKAQYPIAKTKDGYVLGFYAPKSHRVTEAAACPLGPSVFPEILETLRAFFQKYDLSVYDEETGVGLLRHVYLRRGEVSGEVLLTLVVTDEKFPHADELIKTVTQKHKDVVGILLNIQKDDTNVVLGDKFLTLFGRDYLTDTLAGVTLKITAPSFYQVNRQTAELLYAKAKELAAPNPGKTVLDLFCGAGSIGLSMADSGAEIIGVEIVESAIACAKENAVSNGVKNASFYVGDAAETEKLLAGAEKERGAKILPDIIVLDPPRKGCDEAMLHYIAALSPSRIVYVSCNPETLARDVAVLKTCGYFMGEITPFDMFPMTGHVEAVVRLTKR